MTYEDRAFQYVYGTFFISEIVGLGYLILSVRKLGLRSGGLRRDRYLDSHEAYPTFHHSRRYGLVIMGRRQRRYRYTIQTARTHLCLEEPCFPLLGGVEMLHFRISEHLAQFWNAHHVWNMFRNPTNLFGRRVIVILPILVGSCGGCRVGSPEVQPPHRYAWLKHWTLSYYSAQHGHYDA